MDYSYLGAGKAYLREFGSAAPFIEVGNASAVAMAVAEQAITLKDHTQPGGGTYNEVKRIESVDVNMTLHDLSPDNLARAFLGEASAITAGTATAEDVVAYPGGFTPLLHIPTAITAVTGPSASPPYVEGEDFDFVDGGIMVYEDGDIPAPVDGAPNIEVTYTYPLQDKVEALTVSAKDWEMVFVGLNEARSGKVVRVQAHRIKFGPAQALALVSADEHAALEVSGKLQQDSTQAAGLSRYWVARLVA